LTAGQLQRRCAAVPSAVCGRLAQYSAKGARRQSEEQWTTRDVLPVGCRQRTHGNACVKNRCPRPRRARLHGAVALISRPDRITRAHLTVPKRRRIAPPIKLTLTSTSSKSTRYSHVSRQFRRSSLTPAAEWLWRCVLRSITVQCMAAVLIMMSLALIFAEATIITDGKPDLSMFSLMIKSAGDNETLVQVRISPL
jgi:hypothetical protein